MRNRKLGGRFRHAPTFGNGEQNMKVAQSDATPNVMLPNPFRMLSLAVS